MEVKNNMVEKYTNKELRKFGFLPKGVQNKKKLAAHRLPEAIGGMEYCQLPKEIQDKYTLDLEVEKVFELKIWKLKEE